MEVFTDGAATHADVPQLRRAGWGVWVPECPRLSASEPLKGHCQTAQRAELRALVAALERTEGYARVWSDSRFVVTGAEDLARGVVPRRQHSDLWHRASAVWKLGITEVSWVKAHLDWETASKRDISWNVWDGSRQADRLAGDGASAHAVAAADLERVLAARDACQRAQSWMAAALLQVAEQGPRPVQRRQRRQRGTRRRRRLQQGPPGDHAAVRAEANAWVCDDCGRRVKFSRGWRVWRTFPCRRRMRQVPLEGPVVPALEAAAAGRAAHDLRSQDGRTWCTQCGRSIATRWRAKLGTWCSAGKLPGQRTLQECANFCLSPAAS